MRQASRLTVCTIALAALALMCVPRAAWSGALFSEGNMVPQARTIGSQSTNWTRFAVKITTDRKRYNVGDLMDLRVRANRDCYIMVYCVGTDGKTSVVCPSAFSPKNRVFANVPFRLRDRKGARLKQYGPSGTETVQVVATDRPIDVKALLAKVAGASRPPAGNVPTPPDPPAGTDATADDPAAGTPDPPVSGTDTPPLAGEPDAPPVVADPQQFVNETEALIRGFVRTKSRSIGPAQIKQNNPQNAVFGLYSVRYQVVHK